MRRTMRGGGGMREASERRATDGSRLPRSESAVRSRARSRRELKSHQRSKYGKPCAVKVARTVWSRGKARALPIATWYIAEKPCFAGISSVGGTDGALDLYHVWDAIPC